MTTRQMDHFASHLAIVNNSNAVRTTNDIYSQEGAILVAKDTPLSKNIAQKIIKHRLLEPLETCVSLEKSIDKHSLFSSLQALPDTDQIIRFPERDISTATLKKLCAVFASYPLLIQKLTIMSIRLPKLYKKSLLCAYIALGIAQRMQLHEKKIQNIFIAALMHDVGLLHIDPALVEKQGVLESEEWRILKSHTIIAKLFLDMIPHLPNRVGRAVFEHHERTDGSGYPGAKNGDQLCLEGQVVAMADTLTAIYCKQILEHGHALTAIIPILQISSDIHFYNTYKAVLEILREVAPSCSRVYNKNNARKLSNNIIPRIRNLNSWYSLARQLTMEILESLPKEETGIIQTVSARLDQIITTSGLLSESHLDWLQLFSKAPCEDEFSVVEHTVLMLDELEWQCHHWEKAITPITQSCSNAQKISSWQELHTQLISLLKYANVPSREKALHTEALQTA